MAAQDLMAGLPIGHASTSVGRTVTDTEITVLAAMTGSIGQPHVNREFARILPAGDLTLGGPLVVAYAVGLWRTGALIRQLPKVFGVRSLTGLGHEVRYRQSVVAGDTLRVTSTVASARPTSSDPSRGVLTLHEVMTNQRGAVVLEMDRAVLFTRQ